jgi:transcriptional regulator with GAF, ATPase, and Fis domain
LKRDNLALRDAVVIQQELVGSSPSHRAVLKLIERVAPSDATVLIMGESGTGKELVANTIHARSLRRERPMVSINCGAIPESMVESELFGHEKGAFTGAVTRKMGKFELASEGTLFLDEIGELPSGTQVKLLRVLEQRSFYRVGGEELIHVDVRILAATNADLEEKVSAGSFRRDLYYRLKVFLISVPPLRDHREDLPELVAHFLDRIGGEGNFKVTEAGMQRLLAYTWPGNVRELRNVLEREILLSDGAELNLDSMEPGAPAVSAHGEHQVRASLKEVERDHILRVLRSQGWNKKAAAKILGIGRPTVYDKMKQYGIKEGE